MVGQADIDDEQPPAVRGHGLDDPEQLRYRQLLNRLATMRGSAAAAVVMNNGHANGSAKLPPSMVAAAQQLER